MENGVNQKIKEVKALIAKGKTEEAIEVFLAFLENDDTLYLLYNELTIISNQYYQAITSYQLGISSGQKKINKINNAILNLTNKLNEQKGVKKHETNAMLSDIFRRYILAKSSEELTDVKDELKQLKESHPEDKEVKKMADQLLPEDLYDHNARRINERYNYRRIESLGSIGIVIILIFLLILLYSIFF